jgi:two-component system sensor kinase FixL
MPRRGGGKMMMGKTSRKQKSTIVVGDVQNSAPTNSAADREVAPHEQRLRAIFDQIFQFIAVLEPDGTVIEANRAALELRGLAAEDVVGSWFWQTPWCDFSHQTRQHLKNGIAEAARGTFVRFEVALLDREGEPCTFDFSIKPITDAGGRVNILIAEGRDITDRKRVEEALVRGRDELELRVQDRTGELSDINARLRREINERQRFEDDLKESEARTRAVLDTAVDAIITIDANATIESFNPAAERIFGYAAKEVVGRNVRMLMPEPYHSEHDQYMRNYITTGRKKIIGIGREVIGQRKDGSTFPMDLAVSEVRLGDRRIFTGLVRDITERRRLEAQVLEASANEQQRIGQDLHDGLCQQLAGISYATELLAKKLTKKSVPEAKDVRGITDMVDDAITQARGLARGLAPVKMEADGLALALEDLAAQVRGIYKVDCQLSTRGQVLLDDNIVATHLFRVAQEAVNNAIKHGKARHVTIGLSVVDSTLILTIKDDGAGVSAKRAGGSDGIGLHLMAYRARVSGGTFDIRPATGGGTIVTVSVPIRSTRGAE